MYQSSYAEVLEDDQFEARHNEGRALDEAIRLLERAAKLPHPSIDGIKALHLTRQIWTIFVNDLSSSENALPQDLRANLVSIGLWILKEAEAIRLEKSTNYAGIADICTIIRDGLR